MKRLLLILTVSLILPLLFATPALAQGPVGAQVIFGDNLVLESEQTLQRDVVVFGGNVSVPRTSKIVGDVVVFGGQADIDGTVEGDIGMIGGNIDLAETAVVEGDIGLIGGQSNIADGAVVKGRIQNLTRFDYDYDSERGKADDNDEAFTVPPTPPSPPVAPTPPSPPDFPGSSIWSRPFRWISNVISETIWTLWLLIILGLVALLVAAFMPGHMITVRHTVTESTLLSFGLGLLTALMVIGSFLLVLTIILFFVPLLALFLAGIAILFGWIVIGQIIGERLLVASGSIQPNFVVSSVVGVSILTLLTNMPVIGQIPCLGFLLNFLGFVAGLLVSMTGLGAVVLTRFGTQPYPPSGYSIPSSPPPSPAPRAGTPRTSQDLDMASASEAELKAKIKAALAEAEETGQPGTEEPDGTDTPPTDKPEEDRPTTGEKSPEEKEETPETEEPTDVPDKKTDEDPEKKPKPDA